MPPAKRTLFLHVCTDCGYERHTEERLNPSGLCRSCILRRRNTHILHFSPGGLFADETLERFWRHVDKESSCVCHSLEDRCWLWTAGLRTNGYGTFGLKDIGDTWRNMTAHRFAFQAIHGALPSSLHVLHEPPCILKHCVRHLYSGTTQQNAADAKAMGLYHAGERHVFTHKGYVNSLQGEQHPRANTTEAEVRAIRADRDAGMSLSIIAKKYARNKNHIWNIVQQRTWKRTI